MASKAARCRDAVYGEEGRVGVDQIEPDRRAIVFGAVKGDRARNEGEAEMAAPDRALRHGQLLISQFCDWAAAGKGIGKLG